jgi:hypothetical protein
MRMKIAMTIACCAATIALLSPTAEAGKLYRWVDDDGKVHYSDKVPASEAKQARSQLNEHGVEVGHVEAAKTPEERAKAAELEHLRAEQEKLIAKHKEEDRVLLRTFRSEDDIIMSMNGKLTALDVIIQIDHSNSKHTKAKLSELQGIAANQERQGKKVSTKLLAEIDSTRQQLHDIYQNILRREQEKKDTRKKSEADLKRFRTLKKLDQTAQPKVEAAKFKASLLETVVVCKDMSGCDALWAEAERYIRKHSTTPLDLLGDTVMMSKPPREDDDVSITISRINREKQGDTLIFLDLQCKPSTEGKDFCVSEKVSQIRSGFRGALEAVSGSADLPAAAAGPETPAQPATTTTPEASTQPTANPQSTATE